MIGWQMALVGIVVVVPVITGLFIARGMGGDDAGM